MDGQGELERRMIAEAPGLHVNEEENGRTVIRGYAALYDSESQDLGGFVERISPGAFDDVMRGNPDVFGRYNHDRLIARTSSGTLKLELDSRGLRYTMYPKRADADLVESVERGDVRHSSFAFRTGPKNEKWYKDEKGRMVREIRKFDSLHDVSIVDTPAYMATEAFVAKRALEAARSSTEDPPEHPVLGDPEDTDNDDGLEKRAEPGSLEVGDFVEWESSGGTSQGRIERIVEDGSIDVPNSSFTINGTPDDPAALIVVYEEEDDGYEPTDVMVGHRFTTLTKIDPLPEPSEDYEDERAMSLKPTAGMASAARRGLKLHEEGKSGDGLKPETVARANRLARREEMNEDWVREMNAWFARHESASKSPGWDTPGEEKPGYVAWLLWGGNAARNWSARKVKQMESERAFKVAAELRERVALSKARTHLHGK